MTDDDIPVETATINILMHGDDDIEFKTLALGLTDPQILVTMTMDTDFDLVFSIETGGIPFDEDNPKKAYAELGQVLKMLGEQLEAEVARGA